MGYLEFVSGKIFERFIEMIIEEPFIVRELEKYHYQSEHIKDIYSSIWGKEIYPVAIHKLSDKDCKYNFESKAWYFMVR